MVLHPPPCAPRPLPEYLAPPFPSPPCARRASLGVSGDGSWGGVGGLLVGALLGHFLRLQWISFVDNFLFFLLLHLYPCGS